MGMEAGRSETAGKRIGKAWKVTREPAHLAVENPAGNGEVQFFGWVG